MTKLLMNYAMTSAAIIADSSPLISLVSRSLIGINQIAVLLNGSLHQCQILSRDSASILQQVLAGSAFKFGATQGTGELKTLLLHRMRHDAQLLNDLLDDR